MSRLWGRYQPVFLPDALYTRPFKINYSSKLQNTRNKYENLCCETKLPSFERPNSTNIILNRGLRLSTLPLKFGPDERISYRALYSRRTLRSRQDNAMASQDQQFTPFSLKFQSNTLPLSAEHPRLQNSFITIPSESSMPVGMIDLEAMFLKHGYKLGEKLGKGSFAVVKRALHIASGKDMAVKIVDHNLATKEFLHKFLLRELNIIRALKHPNIINVEKIVRIGSYTCVIMEEAKKGDLLECVLKRGHLTDKDSKKVLIGVSKALLFCHKNNIAHRDLKCENILLDDQGEAKLSDFGFARCVLDPVTQKRMLSKTYCGSAAYVAPEVLRGQPYNPMMSDVWSLGVILFIMLTGLMPFDDSNLPKMVQVQIKKKWSFPSGRKELIASECQTLVKHMLEPDITLRITMSQLNNNEWLLKTA